MGQGALGEPSSPGSESAGRVKAGNWREKWAEIPARSVRLGTKNFGSGSDLREAPRSLSRRRRERGGTEADGRTAPASAPGTERAGASRPPHLQGRTCIGTLCCRPQIQTRIANEKYLRAHKEVELLLSGFFREMFLKRPDSVLEFAADYFTDPRLPNKIHMQLIKDKKVT
ncbi:RIIa domain-containing protein 1 [Fukomys damarensis]|uniref:RIIa domain-containing protein 1 n=1 Tax=Fukomys damarensis TaxID=885580 RepID=UPI00053F6284|nr:RIIa domain-containing protein 1 [Fukomys damarensis]